MTEALFLDSGFILALELARDQHRDEAVRLWDELSAAPCEIVTTSYVLSEVIAFLQRRGLHGAAVRVGGRLIQGEGVTFFHVDEPLFREAWAYLVRRPDKSYSLTDCVSFVVMGRLGIASALTFDNHFKQAGFATLP